MRAHLIPHRQHREEQRPETQSHLWAQARTLLFYKELREGVEVQLINQPCSRPHHCLSSSSERWPKVLTVLGGQKGSQEVVISAPGCDLAIVD